MLSVCMAVRNAVSYAYPLQAALDSAFYLADEVVVVYEHTGDGTDDILSRYPVKLIERKWWKSDNESGYTGGCIADAQNLAIEHATCDWFMVLQADEVLHQDEVPLLRRMVWDQDSPVTFELGHVHFWASPELVSTDENSRTRFRVAPRAQYPLVKCIFDGSQLEPGVFVRAHNVKLYHYGNVRNVKALAAKQRDFCRVYYGGNEGDPRLEAGEVDWDAFGHETEPFTGTHPSFVLPWLHQQSLCRDGVSSNPGRSTTDTGIECLSSNSAR